MTLLVTFEQPDSIPLHRGLVEIDIDPAAERFALLDRRDMKTLMFGLKPAAGLVKFIVPFEYTTDYFLLALILDDTGAPSYNVAGADKIMADLCDAKTVSLVS